MQEIWKPIPGCPDYWLSDLGRFKRILKNGKDKFLDTSRGVVITHVNGIETRWRLGKLLYSLFNDIAYERLKNVFIQGSSLKDLKVWDSQSFLEMARKKSYRRYDRQTVETYQREIYQDLSILMVAWDTGEISPVCARIEYYRKDVLDRCSKRFQLGDSALNELWSAARGILIDHIINRDRNVNGFRGWLLTTMKHLIYQRRDAIKKYRSFDDRKNYTLFIEGED